MESMLKQGTFGKGGPPADGFIGVFKNHLDGTKFEVRNPLSPVPDDRNWVV
jgi:hypothetical protein